MPDTQVTVYDVETGEAVKMHSVDAAEACRQGQYTTVEPAPKATPRASAPHTPAAAPAAHGTSARSSASSDKKD